jgi:RNA polymerase sigma-70 factor (ECF subfamily)
MQEILFAAWQALPNFRGDAALRSWIMGIARHKLEDYYRKKIHELQIADEDDCLLALVATPAFEQRLDSATKQQKVQRTLTRLPEPYALALIWQYRDEKSIRDMAQLTGKTEKAMERLLARARESFRRRWNDGEN